ncbi:hypothetical protein llg_26110 [Luteolibacter sp. LG18]|nr:hypothetical protein llg_26110 [Luteolibacter sp. LG18]
MIVLFLLPYPMLYAGWWYLERGICAMPRCSQTNAEIKSLWSSLEMFRIHCGRYPANAEGLDALVHRPAGVTRWEQVLADAPLDPWKQPYRYAIHGPRGKETLELRSLGPDPANPADDIVETR